MSKRGPACDYAGNELYRGDLINYAARHGNRVRVTDAVVLRVTATNVKGIGLVPRLKVRPTGSESGFVARRSLRDEWINAEHVRLIEAAAVDPATL